MKVFKSLNSIFKKIVCCGLLSAVVLGGFTPNVSAAEALKPKQGVLSTFYTQAKDTVDVVFIGSSAVYRFISPAQMYAKHGITSLNYSAAGLDIRTTAGIIREVVAHQHPKVVVVEMRSFINNCDKLIEGVEYTKRQLKNKKAFFKKFVCNMPASENRTKVISDMVTPVFGYNAAKWEVQNFYPKYDVKKYTTEELQAIIEKKYVPVTKKYTYQKDSTYKGYLYKGTIGSKGIAPQKAVNYSDYKKTNEITGDGLQVLTDIIEEAKVCGTEVMFLSTPYPTTKKNIAYENAMKKLFNKNGFRYLNCNKYYKKIGLDFSCDYYDKKHTNVSGMVKVTNFVSNFIVNKYGLKQSKLTSSQKTSWKKASDLWIKDVRDPMLEKVKKYKSKH